MKKEVVDALSYTRLSEHRTKTLLAIGNEVVLPKDISKKTGYRPTHTSRSIKQLIDTGLVECLNPEKVKGRLFVTTNLGKEVLKYIKEWKSW